MGQQRDSRTPLAALGSIAELKKAYQSLSNDGDLVSIQRLQTESRDPSAALLAAWDLTDASLGEDGRVPIAALARFLGFVEGRLSVRPPYWWEAWMRHNFERGYRGSELIYDKPPSNVDWVQEGEFIQVTLPSSKRVAIKSAPRPAGRKVLALEGGRIIVIDQLEDDEKTQVQCFDAATGEQSWAVIALGCAPVFGNSGGHTVSALLTESHAFVFGASPAGNYLEVFDVVSGRCDIRFNTSVCE